jgi:GT2 family glycosyltransferase
VFGASKLVNILNDRLQTEGTQESADLVSLISDHDRSTAQEPITQPKRRLHGHIDLATRTEISGWVWDPKNPPARIRLELSEAEIPIATAIADIERAGLEKAGIGDGRHAFRIVLQPGALSNDAHSLHLRCAETAASVPGSPVLIEAISEARQEPSNPESQHIIDVKPAARPFPKPTRPEFGYCDRVSPTSVEGWAYDPAMPDTPLVMEVFIDGSHIFSVECNRARYDANGNPSKSVGFQVMVPAMFRDGASHEIEFRTRDGSPIALRGATGVQECWTLPAAGIPQQPSAGSSVIFGNLDPIQEHGAFGWAYDRDKPDHPVTLDFLVDGVFLASITCDGERPDVAAAGHPTSRLGFKVEVPSRYFDDLQHVMEVRTRPDDTRSFHTPQGHGGGWQTFRFPARNVIGQVDGLRDGAVRGWVYFHDRKTNTKSGGLKVLVTMQGQPVGQVTANGFRGDVANAFGCDPNCGFTFSPPSEIVAGRTIDLSFKVIPGNHALAGSPVSVSFPSMETLATIRELYDATEKIFTETWLLRDRLRRLKTKETYPLGNYDSWAREYQKLLAAAPNQLHGLLAEHDAGPLVSIICPAYKPRIKDFMAAVESVLAQSYRNWELIIADDASGSPELTACIQAFAKRDTRIKAVHLRENQGISGATNAAMAVAKGSYVALFDHDDLLASRAIEFMLAAALRTGALMLYSDEDKIDDSGSFSDGHFKPDWNYRLLLSINYICHLLLVERSQFDKVGVFRKECDGSQDHDMVLRLSEVIPHDKIVHVPEVLYHWRKTPASTAASGKSKSYTVAAGIRAIQDHLDRLGLPGSAKSPRDITCFEIEWQIAKEPEVTILIPYRDHIGMTRTCLEAIWANTDYENYKIILIDNWSTSNEAFLFADEMNAREGVRILRIEEPFNYSRLNNLAAEKTNSDFLLFLNNDVVVSNPKWLRALVGEMLADPRVGIVGSKLYYPGGLIQHGGVIIGAGGVADHAHKGLTMDEPGYFARSISAQDLSAVTAACLLCRRKAFDEVGGFDEKELQVAFNDVDLCLKVGAAGYRIIWTPGSEAEHRESISRGDDMRPDHQARFFHEHHVMMTRWKGSIAADGFYHRVFSRNSAPFTNLDPPSLAPSFRRIAE